MDKVRFVFKKGDAIRYLGHLDILRTFIRGLRRAEVLVKYSKGFNPHAVLSFALPIGVGVTSDCEIVDVSFDEKIDIPKAVAKINANMPPNSIEIVSGERVLERMPIIERAEYVLNIKGKGSISADEVEKALTLNEILVDKKSKKRTVQINIIEHIFDYKILKCSGDLLTISVVISAGNTVNVRPQLVLKALEGAVPSLDVLYCLYHRKRFFYNGRN